MTSLHWGWPKSSAASVSVANPAIYWRTSSIMPMRYNSIVVVGSTLAITASAFIAAKANCIPSSECEAGESSVREQSRQSPLQLTSNYDHHWHQDQDKQCKYEEGNAVQEKSRRHQNISINTMVLASSPSTPVIHGAQFGTINDVQQFSKPTRKWWRLQWWGRIPQTSRKSDTISWRQRIGRTFFVITRGIEIVARLSPLLILTPTAWAVSYIDPIWKRYIYWNVGKKEGDMKPLLSVECLEKSGDDDMRVMQFQEFNTMQHDHQTTSWASNLAWSYTLHTLQCLGPAFVKLGQWAATRRDLFSVQMCNRLSELHDTARVHDWKYTHEALIEAFGEDYESRGLIVMGGSNARESNGILGSGSAAQVHRGKLTIPAKNSSGNENDHIRTRNVAVKVLHPNTRQLVERDLALMQHIADFIDKCIPLQVVKMLSLPRAVSTFTNVMERQVDLRIEGHNLRIFRDNFGCSKDDEETSKCPPTITFPYPEPEWISERVLVEEYAGDDAVPISKYLADESTEGLKTRKNIAGPLLRAFLKMVFVDNFIHADLHPGNVLVRRAVPSKTNPKGVSYTIIFLDAGIATSLQPNDRNNLLDLFKAVVVNDGYSAGQLMVERARYERCTSILGGKHAFASGVSDIVSDFHDRRKQGLTLGAVRVGALLGQVLDLCRRFGVEIDPAMSSVVVSMMVLEGLGRSLDPDLNLMKAAMPFLLGRGKV
eukprot:CAMPEP_0172304412 /NCGR_PEP_ID=MMETSP1058-20130122/5831_1 /TAXON_ID=83371 /ORGANISM="Detonula confervacea, Strain CCMP 353" /LENGTH=711 /DNA_ID=CAMNT_0013015639 /DNA_START=87 /DNA_END=2222 /DNA_ORIENTATION=+